MLFRTASATVLGSSLPLCDALATALVVAGDDGPEIARSLKGYEAYIIGVDGKEDATDGIVFATERAWTTGSRPGPVCDHWPGARSQAPVVSRPQ
jgi:hypothetical protein